MMTDKDDSHADLEKLQNGLMSKQIWKAACLSQGKMLHLQTDCINPEWNHVTGLYPIQRQMTESKGRKQTPQTFCLPWRIVFCSYILGLRLRSNDVKGVFCFVTLQYNSTFILPKASDLASLLPISRPSPIGADPPW